jgi:hypothetical protein
MGVTTKWARQGRGIMAPHTMTHLPLAREGRAFSGVDRAGP